MCDCVNQLNEQMKNDPTVNTRIVTKMWMDLQKGTSEHLPSIQTEKRDSKNKIKAAAFKPVFCPFCGKRYEREN